ncbi:hypothetical protein DLAC_08546 [Tieghemostelium lacteum]|uniref:Tryptophan synthase beta chain-like PALP domain-containing protein n=1 Tax=Tieghemostelium lacteum TaxID=361077 RepID=A0A151Z7N1_TIELA|nr:hypothetical protein DLAC_08546 [Tieghemostelium lacteum]|eukprot:KYQ89976.1 hypothetical protein DLAC_08546 [Tieghemostelium lacteum]
MSFIKYLECTNTKCNNTEDIHKIQNQCTKCSYPLFVRYHLDKIRSNYTKGTAIDFKLNSLWRYKLLLPVIDDKFIVTLGEGMTPLIACTNLHGNFQLHAEQKLWVKDESQNPTSTFKCRGSSVAMSKVKELGIESIVIPTNGNAGSAWACYGAKSQTQVNIYTPKDATFMAKQESILFGAQVVLVDGLISDCSKMVQKHLELNPKCFDVSTLREPYRLEGKKTMGLEIWEQMNGCLPNVIVYPTGGGVGLIGIYKAFQELLELGWVDSCKMPKFISVQSEGCCPLIEAYERGDSKCTFFNGASTIATGMRVPRSLGDFLLLDIIRQTNGAFITVTEQEIIEMHSLAPKKEGLFMCYEGASALAAIQKAKSLGHIQDSDKDIVVINTGSGLKNKLEYLID